MKHEIAFRPMARMAKILGEHLIRDNTVGLMELIKNGYDADAGKVSVELLDLGNPSETTITVTDDGTGMDIDTIRERWFQPAHGGKEEDKIQKKTTEKGRLPLGEKGVGRFAAQKLGHLMELITRPKNGSTEYCIQIDWDSFDNPSKFMDDIPIAVEARKPEFFKDKKHGTRLVMVSAREPWREKDVARFQGALIRLLSPRKEMTDFSVILTCPEFKEYENLSRWDIIEKFQYKIECQIDEKGTISYAYSQRKEDGKIKTQKSSKNLWASIHPDSWASSPPVCGPLSVQISAWLLKSDILREYGLNREQLRELAGIAIYRDGFRVLPYGDPGDDWLGLDQRRINVPAKRFGNRQVMGVVSLDQLDNPELIDKTNREGLRENQAYSDMREMVLCVLEIIEQLSLTERQERHSASKSRESVETAIDDVKQEVEDIKESAEKNKEEIDLSPNELPEDKVIVDREKLERLENKAESINEFFTDYANASEEEKEIFDHLVGVGLSAERFVHELDRVIHGALAAVNDLKAGNVRKAKDARDYLEVSLNAIANEARLMGAMRYLRRGEKARPISVYDGVVKIVENAYKQEFKKANIKYTVRGNDFKVKVSPSSLTQVVDNVFSNATYWLKQKTIESDRQLHVQLDPSSKSILIGNNGAEIAKHVERHLFSRPFVTTKPNGHGLGMYIAGRILERAGATIRIIRPEKDERVKEGVAFEVIFKE